MTEGGNDEETPSGKKNGFYDGLTVWFMVRGGMAANSDGGQETKSALC